MFIPRGAVVDVVVADENVVDSDIAVADDWEESARCMRMGPRGVGLKQLTADAHMPLPAQSKESRLARLGLVPGTSAPLGAALTRPETRRRVERTLKRMVTVVVGEAG